MSKISSICLCLVAAVHGSCLAHLGDLNLLVHAPSEKPVFVYGGAEFHRFDPGALADIMAWQSPATEARSLYSQPPQLSHVAVSIDGLIAFICREKREDEDSVTALLRIIDRTGHVHHSVFAQDGIRRISWGPDGDRIAYTTAKLHGEDEDRYRDRRTYIYCLKTRASEKVVDGGSNIYWASFDGCLYVYDLQLPTVVSRYDADKKEIAETDYKDIRFSPGGTYYYVYPDSPDGFEMYERATGKLVVDSENSRISPLVLNRVEAFSWFDDTRLLGKSLSPIGPPYRLLNYVIDVKAGTLFQSAGEILGRYTDTEVVVLMPDKTLVSKRIDAMTPVEPQNLPPFPAEAAD